MMNDEMCCTVSERLISEDIAWISEALLQVRHAPAKWQGVLPLLLTGHAARIAYEAVRYARSQHSRNGRFPGLDDLMKHHGAVLEKARHASKYLDNQKHLGTFEVDAHPVLEQLTQHHAAHHEAFTGNARFRWALRWETDLGLYQVNRQVLGSTTPLTHRFGLPAGAETRGLGPVMFDLAREIGEVFEWFHAHVDDYACGDFAGNEISYRNLPKPQLKDVMTTQYLNGRFDPSFSQPLKLLLLHVAGELNTQSLIIDTTTTCHDDARLRSRFLMTYHAISLLQKLHDRELQRGTKYRVDLSALLDSPEAQTVHSSPHLRNCFIHYGIDPKRLAENSLNLRAPTSGLVEALVDEDCTHTDFVRDVNLAHSHTSAVFNSWLSGS